MLLQMQERTGEVPPALASRPRLEPMLAQYMDWFRELSYSRSHSESGPGSLTTGAIETYRRVFEIEDRDDFHCYMRMIDNLWLAEVRKKLEAKHKK